MAITGTGPIGRGRTEIVCDSVGRQLTIRIRGEIDHHTAVTVRQEIDNLLFERRPGRLVLDLSAISFMDSSGLGLIMGRFSVMKELGGELVVWNPSRETRRILTLAGMERLVRLEYPAGDEPEPVEENAGVVRRRASGNPSGGASGSGRQAPRRRKGTSGPRSSVTRKEKDA